MATELKQLAEETGDPISFKVNNSLGGFAKYNDSLVIHCTQEANIDRVRDILKFWKNRSKITSVPRYLDRSEVAIDGRHETGGRKMSFSEIIAQQSLSYAKILTERQIHPHQAAEAVVAAALMWAQKIPTIKEK